jgi:hypothetical protein
MADASTLKNFILGFVFGIVGLLAVLNLLPTVFELFSNTSSQVGGASGAILGIGGLLVTIGVLMYVINTFVG